VSKVSYIILNMFDIIFVTTDNCELCSRALNKIKKLRLLINLKFVNVENDYQEFLLRVPVVLYKGEILDEGQISLMKILKKLIFKI
jgi:siroheme synthase (precorrin-2 oxidase/ferrochelatase)